MPVLEEGSGREKRPATGPSAFNDGARQCHEQTLRSMKVEDHPGVLAEIASTLADKGANVRSDRADVSCSTRSTHAVSVATNGSSEHCDTRAAR
jgi:ACT domain-containing protein